MWVYEHSKISLFLYMDMSGFYAFILPLCLEKRRDMGCQYSRSDQLSDVGQFRNSCQIPCPSVVCPKDGNKESDYGYQQVLIIYKWHSYN